MGKITLVDKYFGKKIVFKDICFEGWPNQARLSLRPSCMMNDSFFSNPGTCLAEPVTTWGLGLGSIP